MAFTLEDILALRAGHRGPVIVGELNLDVAEYMGLYTPQVYLSRDSLNHINDKHPDVTDFDLMLAHFAIRKGWILQELKKPHIYLCSYFDQHSRRRFGGAMKVASPGREVYLQSFHRCHRRQTIAWQKRCNSIRTHL